MMGSLELGCGEGKVERSRSGEGRQRCGGEDKLHAQKQTVFVPEVQCVNGQPGRAFGKCACVHACVCEWFSLRVLLSQASAVE